MKIAAKQEKTQRTDYTRTSIAKDRTITRREQRRMKCSR